MFFLQCWKDGQTELDNWHEVKITALGNHFFSLDNNPHNVFNNPVSAVNTHYTKILQNSLRTHSITTVIKWSCWQDFKGVSVVNISTSIQNWLTWVTCIYLRGNMRVRSPHHTQTYTRVLTHTHTFCPPGLTWARLEDAISVLAKASLWRWAAWRMQSSAWMGGEIESFNSSVVPVYLHFLHLYLNLCLNWRYTVAA